MRIDEMERIISELGKAGGNHTYDPTRSIDWVLLTPSKHRRHPNMPSSPEVRCVCGAMTTRWISVGASARPQCLKCS